MFNVECSMFNGFGLEWQLRSRVGVNPARGRESSDASGLTFVERQGRTDGCATSPNAVRRKTRRAAAAVIGLLLLPLSAYAQELEPGAYWPIPAGLNIATVVNSLNWGDVAFDPAAPIDQATARINTTVLAFTRALSVAGRSTNLGIVVPMIAGHVE